MSQRREARRSIRLECRKGAHGLGKDVGDAILDVSEDGVRVMLKVELPLKQEVEVIICPADGRSSIKRLANVMWVVKTEENRFCAGLKFQKRMAYADVAKLARP